jgi:hypothetical protein
MTLPPMQNSANSGSFYPSDFTLSGEPFLPTDEIDGTSMQPAIQPDGTVLHGDHTWDAIDHLQVFNNGSIFGDHFVYEGHMSARDMFSVPSESQGQYSTETNPRKVSLPHENPSDSDGDIVPPPTIPNIPTLVRLEYCNLQSHAEFLVSEDGPPAMGVRKQSVKFAKNRLRKRPENFAGCNVLPKYGKWAADKAGETYKEICRRCFIKYQDYFHLCTKMHATCCCQVIKGKGNKGNRQKYRTESRDLSKATRKDLRRDTSKKA